MIKLAAIVLLLCAACAPDPTSVVTEEPVQFAPLLAVSCPSECPVGRELCLTGAPDEPPDECGCKFGDLPGRDPVCVPWCDAALGGDDPRLCMLAVE